MILFLEDVKFILFLNILLWLFAFVPKMFFFNNSGSMARYGLTFSEEKSSLSFFHFHLYFFRMGKDVYLKCFQCYMQTTWLHRQNHILILNLYRYLRLIWLHVYSAFLSHCSSSYICNLISSDWTFQSIADGYLLTCRIAIPKQNKIFLLIFLHFWISLHILKKIHLERIWCIIKRCHFYCKSK